LEKSNLHSLINIWYVAVLSLCCFNYGCGPVAVDAIVRLWYWYI